MKSNNFYSHPGYLYQLTRDASGLDSVLKRGEGIKEKEEGVYIYLTPSTALSTTNPFNNCRLKSIMNDVEVIVFDRPPEKEPNKEGLQNFCKLLQKKYNKETLLNINTNLTNSLTKIQPILSEVDQKVGEDPEKLATAIVAKILLLLAKNHGKSSQGSESIETPIRKLPPKEQIHLKAEETKKKIEYLDADSRNYLEKNEDALFGSGFLEYFMCSFITDESLLNELMKNLNQDEENWNKCELKKVDFSTLEKHPSIIELKKRLGSSNSDIDEMLTLAKKVNTSLASKKKTLFVLEESPETIQKLKSFIPIFSDMFSDKVEIKGPIKEPTGPFWKIKDKENKTVGYLLGSIHITPNYLHDLNSRIRKCFEKSKTLAVEIDITRHDIKSKRRAEIKNERKKKFANLPTDQVDTIVNNLKIIFPDQFSEVNFNKRREKMAFIFDSIATLKSRIFKELELYSGIDLQLVKQAKKAKKPVEDLETLKQYEEQENTKTVLEDDPEPDLFLKILSKAELAQSVETNKLMNFIIEQLSLQHNEFLKPLFDAWEEGKLEKFDHSKEASIDTRMTMTQRNMNMAKKICKLVSAKDKVFCCVGASHTVGEMSVQDFLKKFGYSTERVFV